MDLILFVLFVIGIFYFLHKRRIRKLIEQEEALIAAENERKLIEQKEKAKAKAMRAEKAAQKKKEAEENERQKAANAEAVISAKRNAYIQAVHSHTKAIESAQSAKSPEAVLMAAISDIPMILDMKDRLQRDGIPVPDFDTTVFDQLYHLYIQQEKYDKALSVCETSISYNMYTSRMTAAKKTIKELQKKNGQM